MSRLETFGIALVLPIIVPKIIKSGGNLMKLWQTVLLLWPRHDAWSCFVQQTCLNSLLKTGKL